MHVIFYIATSVNGCIADKDGNTDWSPEDNAGYMATCQKAGAVIMGRKTYGEYLTLSDADWPNPRGTTVILSSKSSLPKNNFDTHFASTPQESLLILENIGKSDAVVIGGNQTWTAFMQAGLIDEIFIDIEPLAFGNGLNLFSGADFVTRLKLEGTKLLGTQTIQLHYSVLKTT